jgi:uncharacterized BrkB/YihY/UPF0761 family membrane protein
MIKHILALLIGALASFLGMAVIHFIVNSRNLEYVFLGIMFTAVSYLIGALIIKLIEDKLDE